jgi:hypothetical protein
MSDEINAIMGGEIIRGRKAIMAFFGVRSWRTIQIWRECWQHLKV